MKKLIFIAVMAIFVTACNNNKSKEGDKPAATGEDAALTSWLSGKMLNSTKKDPNYDMYNHLKLNADGTCTDKGDASAKWKVENGEFLFIASMTLKNKITKKNDSTVVFKGSISDDDYILTPIK